jgi:hypothetical protein
MPFLFAIDVVVWLAFLALVVMALASLVAWRHLAAKRLFLSHCDVAIKYPEFADPEGRLDMRSHMVGGDKTAFEQYEWYVARLVYTLDECLSLCPKARWAAVAGTQLGQHRHYFASDYYAKQDYLPHYSKRMQRLITQQREAA